MERLTPDNLPEGLSLVEMGGMYESCVDPVVDHRFWVRRLPADVVVRDALAALTWDRQITTDLGRARNGLVREALRAGATVTAVADALGVDPPAVPPLGALDDLLGEP